MSSTNYNMKLPFHGVIMLIEFTEMWYVLLSAENISKN